MLLHRIGYLAFRACCTTRYASIIGSAHVLAGALSDELPLQSVQTCMLLILLKGNMVRFV